MTKRIRGWLSASRKIAASEVVVPGRVVGEDARRLDLDHEIAEGARAFVEAEAAAAVEEHAELPLVAEMAAAKRIEKCSGSISQSAGSARAWPPEAAAW
jgi:hypothetical protein